MAQIDAYWQLRERMVDEQLGGRDISDRRVLEAMRFVPRHRFVPQDAAELAYIDAPLPIGFRQTISQPYIVALMTQLLRLRGDEVVLEVGTGSGYQAAVLGRLARRVHTVERIPELAQSARRVLGDLGLDNVEVHVADGSGGLPEAAPFDAILVAAAAPKPPARCSISWRREAAWSCRWGRSRVRFSSAGPATGMISRATARRRSVSSPSWAPMVGKRTRGRRGSRGIRRGTAPFDCAQGGCRAPTRLGPPPGRRFPTGRETESRRPARQSRRPVASASLGAGPLPPGPERSR